MPESHTLQLVASWKLSVRHGSEVFNEAFESLDDAIASMTRRAEEIQAEGPLPAASTLRDYQARDQVHARLQLTGRGLLRKPVAGVDVRGDGSLVAYRGGLRREELEPDGQETPFDVVRKTLAAEAE
jgi:hypothetical protein